MKSFHKLLAVGAIAVAGVTAGGAVASAAEPTFKQQCDALGGGIARTIYDGDGTYTHNGPALGDMKYITESFTEPEPGVGFTYIDAKVKVGFKIRLARIDTKAEEDSVSIEAYNSRRVETRVVANVESGPFIDSVRYCVVPNS